MHILIVEDDEVARDYLAKALREVGHTVDVAGNGLEGLHLASSIAVDLAIVDRMLPKLDGLALVQSLRATGRKMPVLILSALGDVDDRITGLRAGGDDYLTKPYHMSELLARIDALARRGENGSAEANTKLKLADLELDRMTRRVMRNGKKIELTAREFQLLEFMMRHSGQVVTRTMLLEGVWDYHFDPQTNVIDVHISRLRQAIDKDFDKPLLAYGARGGVQLARRRVAVGPDQRFLGVLDTSPFRIAIVYSIAFACGAAALLGAVDFAVSRVVDGSTDNLIEAEVQGLREQMLVLSRSDFIELIEQRSQDQDVRGAVYLMVDPQLRPVAGNVPAWPKLDAGADKWFLFKVSVPFGDETREHEMRAQRFPLPGGYRMLVGHDVQERQDVKSLMMRGLIAAVVMTLLLGLGGGFWMGRRILAQAGAISAVATQIMRGDLSQRLPVRDADDEINTLAREINTMLDKIEQLTLGMRTVLDSAAHDLRTPLNRLQATAEGAMTQLESGSPERRVLERVTTEVDHMRSTLDALLRIALAETGTVAREPVDLSELVASVVELYAPVSEERGIQLESSVAAGAEVLGSRQLLAQALANLLDNAIKFTPDGGHIRVVLRGSGSEPEVIVEDSGPGIPADKREIVLGRRVRLDEARKFPGSGLGLSLVAAVTKLHGARLILDDAAPGLRVSLRF